MLSIEKIKPSATANHCLSPKRVRMNNSRKRLIFKTSYLKQDKASTPKNVLNLFIANEYDAWSHDLSTDFTLS